MFMNIICLLYQIYDKRYVNKVVAVNWGGGGGHSILILYFHKHNSNCMSCTRSSTLVHASIVHVTQNVHHVSSHLLKIYLLQKILILDGVERGFYSKHQWKKTYTQISSTNYQKYFVLKHNKSNSCVIIFICVLC